MQKSSGNSARKAASVFRWLLLLWAFSPVICMTALYSMAFIAFRALGHWPVPMYDGGVDTGPILAFTVIGGFFLAIPSHLAVMVLATHPSYRETFSRRRYLVLRIATLGFLVFVALLIFDPGRCFEWLAD